MTNSPSPSAQTVTADPTPTPWRYRPDHYDDWGWIKGPDGKLAAVARSSGEYDSDEHRAAGTDPYGPNAAFIIEAVNNHARLTTDLAAASARIGELEKVAKKNERLALECRSAAENLSPSGDYWVSKLLVRVAAALSQTKEGR